MNQALTTIEAMLETIYAELKRLTNNNELTDQAFAQLKEASVDAINLKQKVASARSWNSVG